MSGEILTQKEGIIAPDAVRFYLAQLEAQYQRLLRKKSIIEQEIRVNEEKVEDLRARCPHENIQPQSFTDGVESKIRPVCMDCGLERPPTKKGG